MIVSKTHIHLVLTSISKRTYLASSRSCHSTIPNIDPDQLAAFLNNVTEDDIEEEAATAQAAAWYYDAHLEDLNKNNPRRQIARHCQLAHTIIFNQYFSNNHSYTDDHFRRCYRVDRVIVEQLLMISNFTTLTGSRNTMRPSDLDFHLIKKSPPQCARWLLEPLLMDKMNTFKLVNQQRFNPSRLFVKMWFICIRMNTSGNPRSRILKGCLKRLVDEAYLEC